MKTQNKLIEIGRFWGCDGYDVLSPNSQSGGETEKDRQFPYSMVSGR